MNTETTLRSRFRPSAGLRAALLVASTLAALSITVGAQTIFVANNNGTNGIASYNINGTLINSSLIPGDGFTGLVLSGSTLYYADASSGAPEIRRATLNGTGGVSSTGAFFGGSSFNGVTSPWGLAATATELLVANFNSGNVFGINYNTFNISSQISTNNSNGGAITNPHSLAISGNTLFVSQATTGTGLNTIKGYSLSTMSSTPTITITTDLAYPHGLAVSGNTLFVANGQSGTITTYDATSGASNGALVTGLTGPEFLTIYGTSLFVTSNDGTVKGFNTSTGAPLAGFTTITGLNNPYGIVVSPLSAIPEPSTYAAIAGAAMLGLAVWQRRRKSAPAALAVANTSA